MATASGALTRRTAALVTLMLLHAFSTLPVHAQTAPRMKFQTSQGDFVVELQADKAPKTVENFLRYVHNASLNAAP